MINLTPHALLFTFAAVGISVTAYLIRQRRAQLAPVCPIGEECLTVLSSSYNRFLLGIPNDVAGFLFYVVFSVIVGLIVLEVPSAPMLLQIASGLLVAASLFSLFLTYLQWRVIRAWCFWCLMSAAIIGCMDLIVVTSNLL